MTTTAVVSLSRFNLRYIRLNQLQVLFHLIMILFCPSLPNNWTILWIPFIIISSKCKWRDNNRCLRQVRLPTQPLLHTPRLQLLLLLLQHSGNYLFQQTCLVLLQQQSIHHHHQQQQMQHWVMKLSLVTTSQPHLLLLYPLLLGNQSLHTSQNSSTNHFVQSNLDTHFPHSAWKQVFKSQQLELILSHRTTPHSRRNLPCLH